MAKRKRQPRRERADPPPPRGRRKVRGQRLTPAPPSPYRAMWIMTMFDLPVTDKAARKAYARFRKELLKDGFIMLQFSVYGRYCASEDAAQVHLARVRGAIPGHGQIRVMTVTDTQFSKMRIYEGKNEVEPEGESRQLELF